MSQKVENGRKEKKKELGNSGGDLCSGEPRKVNREVEVADRGEVLKD